MLSRFFETIFCTSNTTPEPEERIHMAQPATTSDLLNNETVNLLGSCFIESAVGLCNAFTGFGTRRVITAAVLAPVAIDDYLASRSNTAAEPNGEPDDYPTAPYVGPISVQQELESIAQNRVVPVLSRVQVS